ncbi:MAG TPA: penicillin-binding protein 2 [Bryobacteraceae bacterium]
MSPQNTDRGRPQEPTNRLLRDDTRFALGRIAVFQYATVAVFLFLMVGFWLLQVRDHEVNSELAERNRIKTVPLVAPRGKILDRDGRVIVDNRPSFRVLLSRENLNKDHFAAIAEGLHMDLEDLQKRVKRYDSRPKYEWVPIKNELSRGEMAFVESHRNPQTFPELELVEDPSARLYPQNGLAAHVVGYVGEVSDAQLDQPEFAKYSQGEIVGKSGLEQQYNDILMGVDGERRVEVDNVGRERQEFERVEATPGRSLQTTLDLDLQAVAELSMEGRKGAVVALDPRNGEVLAMVSRPTFDPGKFEGHIRQQDWDAMVNDPDTPLLNNAIQAQLAPGSTFKPIVALAGLETGLLEPSTTYFCPGYATFSGVTHKCDAVHGKINLHQAIVKSCDVYFYNVGNKIGIDTIAEYGKMAGFGKKTGIDLPAEAEGIMPSPKWKLRTQHEKWYAGETVSVAIGQGALIVTPIQLAVAIGGLAMGGEWYKPHLVRNAPGTDQPTHANLHPENIATIVSAMNGVVTEEGTGTSARIPGIDVCGKTGTAQRISNTLAKSNKALASTMKDSAWFVAFSPCDHPEIVVAALWESGEHGALAAPIVRDVIKAYFDKKNRQSQAKPQQIAWFHR